MTMNDGNNSDIMIIMTGSELDKWPDAFDDDDADEADAAAADVDGWYEECRGSDLTSRLYPTWMNAVNSASKTLLGSDAGSPDGRGESPASGPIPPVSLLRLP